MNEVAKERAGMLVAVFLAAVGLANLYWATGTTWPAPDTKTLTLALLNAPVSIAPSVTVPLACLSFGSALIALARVHRLGTMGRLIPSALLQLGILAIAGALGLRALGGVGWALGFFAVHTPVFYTLNLLVYTPICLIFCAVAVAAACSRRSPGEPAGLARRHAGGRGSDQ